MSHCRFDRGRAVVVTVAEDAILGSVVSCHGTEMLMMIVGCR